jgi:aspartyl protease family protein
LSTVRQRLMWVLLIGLLIAILVLIAQHGQGTVGPLSTGDFGSLAYQLALLIFLAAAVLTLFRERFAQAIISAVLWVVVGLLLVIGYSYRYELGDVGDRVLAELIPGHVVSHGRTVEVARTGAGDFAIAADVNGAHVHMVLDTGASSVVLTQDDAKAAGLPIALLDYTVSIDTANGRTRAAVDALVVQPGQLQTSLLGMSFLNRLQSWQVVGDRLVLKGYP